MIRQANFNDIEVLAHLMGELGYPTTVKQMEQRFHKLRSHPYHTLVYEVDGSVAAMLGMLQSYRYESDNSYVRIVAMVVDTKYRGLGIGKELLLSAEKWAINIGAKMISLNSGNRKERSDAHRFYESQGFIGSATGFYKKL